MKSLGPGDFGLRKTDIAIKIVDLKQIHVNIVDSKGIREKDTAKE